MITIHIKDGPSVEIDFYSGMNGQQALEAAYNKMGAGNEFTYSLQYYGSGLGYLVDMINETYDTFISKYEPYFFWEFLVNGTVSSTGIDGTILADNDIITFEYTTYSAAISATSTLQAKYKVKKLAVA